MLFSISEDHLEVFRSALKINDLEIYLGPITKEFRSDLRQDLFDRLDNKNLTVEKIKILNLKHLPHFSEGDSSLSHGTIMMGYTLTFTNNILGFDIESIDRAKEPVVSRVSTETEIQTAPGPAHLWVAKEAAFKTLSKSMNATFLSEVKISQWVPLENEAYIVSATYGDRRITGCLHRLSDCFYCVFNS